MKKLSRFLLLAGMVSSILWSCKKEENRIYLEEGTAPALTSTVASGGTLPLSFANKDEQSIKLSWTNPNYKFTTGLSSQDVTYQIEIDTTGANFTNPNKKVIAVSKDLSWTATQGELNDYLLNQLVLKPGMPHNIEMRVISTLTNNSARLVSNVLKYTVTPYAIPPKVALPSTGKLFITGSATPASWQCGCGEAENASQRFTQVSPTLYELTIQLNGGQSYLLLPQYGSWSAKYGGTGSNNANNPGGDDFKDNGSDLIAPAASGRYKITVDFQRGKFTVTPA